jgi:exodeoxyribonuclease V
VELSEDQSKVLNSLLSNFQGQYYSAPIVTTVGGYAGTGKTTLLCELRNQINKISPRIKVAFLTYTGKASSVLNEKLTKGNYTFAGDFIGTIHKLIYIPITKFDHHLQRQVIVEWRKRSPEELFYDIFIIDEASMVGEEIWSDLTSYGTPIIAIGDHGQLPPVGSSFNLLQKPDFKLTQIHRQALDSPIIQLSILARQQGNIPVNRFFSKEVFKLSWRNPMCRKIWDERITFDQDIIVLCAFNKTRCKLNNIIRDKLSYTHLKPYPGEPIVCLKNNHQLKIMNGQIFKVSWVMPEDYKLNRLTIEYGDEIYESLASSSCFGKDEYDTFPYNKALTEFARERGFESIDYFDYGYALSVHKSQGSEWNRVVVFEQRTKHWDDEYYARWLYTAITRAKNKLFLITDFY